MGCGASASKAPPEFVQRKWKAQIMENEDTFLPFADWKETFEPSKKKKSATEGNHEDEEDHKKKAHKNSMRNKILFAVIDRQGDRAAEKLALILMEFIARLLDEMQNCAHDADHLKKIGLSTDKAGQLAAALNTFSAMASTYRFIKKGRAKFCFLRRDVVAPVLLLKVRALMACIEGNAQQKEEQLMMGLSAMLEQNIEKAQAHVMSLPVFTQFMNSPAAAALPMPTPVVVRAGVADAAGHVTAADVSSKLNQASAQLAAGAGELAKQDAGLDAKLDAGQADAGARLNDSAAALQADVGAKLSDSAAGLQTQLQSVISGGQADVGTKLAAVQPLQSLISGGQVGVNQADVGVRLNDPTAALQAQLRSLSTTAGGPQDLSSLYGMVSSLLMYGVESQLKGPFREQLHARLRKAVCDMQRLADKAAAASAAVAAADEAVKEASAMSNDELVDKLNAMYKELEDEVKKEIHKVLAKLKQMLEHDDEDSEED